MGKRQNKNGTFFRAIQLVILLLPITLKATAQDYKVQTSVFLQNAFLYESTEESKILIDFKTKVNCDTIVGVLSTFFTKDNLSKKEKNIWRLDRILFFDYENGKVAIVKITMKKDSNILGTKSFLFKVENNKCWQNFINPQLNNILFSVQYIKPGLFWTFYNQNNSNIEAIDKIKSQFKDSEGILDIDKLGAYLRTKPKEMEKYCDF